MTTEQIGILTTLRQEAKENPDWICLNRLFELMSFILLLGFIVAAIAVLVCGGLLWLVGIVLIIVLGMIASLFDDDKD